jgi:hypothetical protein
MLDIPNTENVFLKLSRSKHFSLKERSFVILPKNEIDKYCFSIEDFQKTKYFKDYLKIFKSQAILHNIEEIYNGMKLSIDNSKYKKNVSFYLENVYINSNTENEDYSKSNIIYNLTIVFIKPDGEQSTNFQKVLDVMSTQASVSLQRIEEFENVLFYRAIINLKITSKKELHKNFKKVSTKIAPFVNKEGLDDLRNSMSSLLDNKDEELCVFNIFKSHQVKSKHVGILNLELKKINILKILLHYYVYIVFLLNSDFKKIALDYKKSENVTLRYYKNNTIIGTIINMMFNNLIVGIKPKTIGELTKKFYAYLKNEFKGDLTYFDKYLYFIFKYIVVLKDDIDYDVLEKLYKTNNENSLTRRSRRTNDDIEEELEASTSLHEERIRRLRDSYFGPAADVAREGRIEPGIRTQNTTSGSAWITGGPNIAEPDNTIEAIDPRLENVETQYIENEPQISLPEEALDSHEEESTGNSTTTSTFF